MIHSAKEQPPPSCAFPSMTICAPIKNNTAEDFFLSIQRLFPRSPLLLFARWVEIEKSRHPYKLSQQLFS